MRQVFLQLLLAGLAAVALARPALAATASDEVRARLDQELGVQIRRAIQQMPASQTLSPEELERQAAAAVQQGRERYARFFHVSEGSARELLDKGPDDLANLLAMQQNAAIYREVKLPLPALLQYLHQQVATRVIRGGWELELARRVSDAHVQEAVEARQKRDAAGQNR